MKGINLSELAHQAAGLFPISANGLTTLDAVNMRDHAHIRALILAGATNGAAITVTVLASSDAAATGATAIAFAYYKSIVAASDVLGARTLATTAGFAMSNDSVSNTMYAIEIDASELPDGKPWINVTFSGAATTTPVSVLYDLTGARYAAPSSPTELA